MGGPGGLRGGDSRTKLLIRAQLQTTDGKTLSNLNISQIFPGLVASCHTSHQYTEYRSDVRFFRPWSASPLPTKCEPRRSTLCKSRSALSPTSSKSTHSQQPQLPHLTEATCTQGIPKAEAEPHRICKRREGNNPGQWSARRSIQAWNGTYPAGKESSERFG